MIDVVYKFFDETQKVAALAHRATVRALQKASYAIFRQAKESIEQSPKPSPAGQPPHTRKGQLKRAIRYDVDKTAETAVIGPRFSEVGTSAEAQEFGGEYKGDEFQERPFMGPALQSNRDQIPAYWSGEVNS